jgi:hypothetical protein
MSKEIDRQFMAWTVVAEDGRRIDVEVRYRQRYANADSVPTFYVKHVNPDFEVADSDLERLRVKVKERFEAVNRVAWSPKLILSTAAASGGVVRASLPIVDGLSDGGSAVLYCYDEGVDAGGDLYYRHRVTSTWGRLDAAGVRWAVHKGRPYDPDEHDTVAKMADKVAVLVMDDTADNRERARRFVRSLAALRVAASAMINRGDLDGLAALAAGLSGLCPKGEE